MRHARCFAVFALIVWFPVASLASGGGDSSLARQAEGEPAQTLPEEPVFWRNRGQSALYWMDHSPGFSIFWSETTGSGQRQSRQV